MANKEMTMEELNEFQKWCKDLVTVAQACAEGKEVERQDIDGKWHKKHTTCGFEFGHKYRIKPSTITVNGFEVPEPMREAPEYKSHYYIAGIVNESLFQGRIWTGDAYDKRMMSRSICHTVQEAAIAHAKAMLGIDPNGYSK